MNGSLARVKTLVAEIAHKIDQDDSILGYCDFLVCPTYVHLHQVRDVLDRSTSIFLGAQDCALGEDGAYTGDISAAMLRDAGCAFVILGHSERRQYHGETDEIVKAKAEKAHAQGLHAIICVGETEEQREADAQEAVVGAQLEAAIPEGASAQNTTIAYEPVWAIGTGKTASPQDVKDMHGFIRGKLSERLDDSDGVRILYGGSMKPSNAAELLSTENVDGGLIGGASLDPQQFIEIAQAALAKGN